VEVWVQGEVIGRVLSIGEGCDVMG
jgi:hypothetical protein